MSDGMDMGDNTMTNMETKLAWDCHAEYFEYFALEYPEGWLELSKEYFTHEHGADECALIDWEYIRVKLCAPVAAFLEEEGNEIYAADPAYRAFYNLDEETTQ
jgi:hypothetical protein